MRTFIALLVLVASPVFAFDIKGLEVDKPVDCEKINAMEYRLYSRSTACQNGEEVWMVRASFLSGEADMFMHQSRDRNLLMISVSNFDFKEALDALTLKWGPPKIEKSIIQNRAGASFEQIEAQWKSGKELLKLSKHGRRIDEANLRLTGEEAIKAFKKEGDEKAKRNQGNI
jgi:hypothetical protein